MCPIDQEFQIISLEDTRFYHCHIKTLNLLPNVIASQRGKGSGMPGGRVPQRGTCDGMLAQQYSDAEGRRAVCASA